MRNRENYIFVMSDYTLRVSTYDSIRILLRITVQSIVSFLLKLTFRETLIFVEKLILFSYIYPQKTTIFSVKYSVTHRLFPSDITVVVAFQLK